MNSPKQSSKPKNDDPRFRVLSEIQKSVEIVGLRGEIMVWCDRPFNEYPDAFLNAWELLLTPIRDKLSWYQNYTMDRFSPVTARTFSAPKTWLTRGRQDVARMLLLKGSTAKMSSGAYTVAFEYHPDEALLSDTNTPFLRRATPSGHLESSPNEFLDTTRQICDLLPFLCGHVGYSMELSPYLESEAERSAYPLAMRHPGVHISTDNATWPLRDEKGAETVNWLTLLGQIPLRKLGGADKLRRDLAETPEIELIETRHGLILKAGDKPQIGDSNRKDTLPLYRAVYRTIAPVLDPVIKDFTPFTLGTDDDAGRTERWLRRFES